ncbi:dynein heavy chain 5, axonemal-like [Oreochromis niloticus]|uniref:dynein heavy chain 5, axonemal-like n=1 Tax=Oreochromis niloticus TaxID=8128 RepID=UPI0009056657|nr:dynein heavy chain 5, axonemal-like [Oreochromis niloticus]
MLEHIPSLMNGIKMIHVVSQYYTTSERMSSLLLKVTNQMISTCRSYLLQGVRRVWEHSRPVLLQQISDYCNLNAAYQRSFHSVRDKLRGNPENRQFDFSENYIFGKFDSPSGEDGRHGVHAGEPGCSAEHEGGGRGEDLCSLPDHRLHN